MTLLFRSLFLGYGSATFLSLWLLGSSMPWVALIASWIGGAILSLVYAGLGMLIVAERAAAQESLYWEAEFRRWDEDSILERSAPSPDSETQAPSGANLPRRATAAEHARASGSGR